MLLACHHIQKSFGTNVILRDASFHIEEKEKAAIVGINGAGKSTLLKLIVGLEDADRGEIVLAKGKTIGYLAQHQELSLHQTIYEELLSVKQPVIDLEQKMRAAEKQMKQLSGHELEALMETYASLSHQFEQEGGYAYKSEVTGVLKGLGFSEEEFTKHTGVLSGGQKTRIALGKLLLTKPDLLLMDEPTNHLDLNSITWLETYLQNYDGAVILVSHDRYFLDRLARKVIEIKDGDCTVFSGNYTEYAKKSRELLDAKLHAYWNQQAEIARQEEVIRKLKSFNREKSVRRAQSREKMLRSMDRIERPKQLDANMRLSLQPALESGNDVLHIEHLSKRFGDQQLFSDLAIDIKRGERVALIGGNGSGKTTILKIINGLLAPDQPDQANITLGSNVTIAYYDQEYHVLHPEKTIFEEISDAYPNLTNTEIRNLLAAFLFTGDDVFAPIHTLSGGECGRVSLAKLMLSQANFLILDEPTNHLDMVSKEILEKALLHYSGTILYVSHDRYFINQTATRILELTHRTLVPCNGNYDYYLEKREDLIRLYTGKNGGAPSPREDRDAPASGSGQTTESKQSWQEHKEQQAAMRKRENQLNRLELEITDLEEQLRGIDAQLSDPDNGANAPLLMELSRSRQQLEDTLNKKMEEWESLA